MNRRVTMIGSFLMMLAVTIFLGFLVEKLLNNPERKLRNALANPKGVFRDPVLAKHLLKFFGGIYKEGGPASITVKDSVVMINSLKGEPCNRPFQLENGRKVVFRYGMPGLYSVVQSVGNEYVNSFKELILPDKEHNREEMWECISDCISLKLACTFQKDCCSGCLIKGIRQPEK